MIKQQIPLSRPTITRKEMEGVLDCLIDEELDSGKKLKEFEKLIQELTGINYILTLSSLTAAYHLIFKTLKEDGKNEVVMPSFMQPAPINGAQMAGMTPRLVDCDEQDAAPSPEMIKKAITENTAAVIVADTFGFHFDLDSLEDLPVPIINDISHSLGAEKEFQVKAAFTVASFASDMILTTGNGAFLGTSNSKSYSKMKDFRSSPDKIHYDYELTDFQAAMGISQITRLKDFIKRRRDIARKYHDALTSSPHKSLRTFNESFAYQSFPLFFDAPAERIDKFWKKNGVEVGPVLPFPLHTRQGERGLNYPQSDRLSRKLYSIPLYPTLTKKEIEKIAKLLSSFI